MANSYRRGQKVSVYYHPENPKENLLKPGIHASAWFSPLAGMAIFFIGILIPKLFSWQSELTLKNARDAADEFEPSHGKADIQVDNVIISCISGGLKLVFSASRGRIFALNALPGSVVFLVAEKLLLITGWKWSQSIIRQFALAMA